MNLLSIILVLILPVAVGIFTIRRGTKESFFYKIANHDNGKAIIVCLFLVLAVFVSLLTDYIDFSEIGESNKQSIIDSSELLKKELATTYCIEGINLENVYGRVNELTNNIISEERGALENYGFLALLSLLLALYVYISVMSTNYSEKLELEIKEYESNVSIAFYIKSLLTRLKTLKTTKIKIIEEKLDEYTIPIVQDDPQRTILSPEELADIIAPEGYYILLLKSIASFLSDICKNKAADGVRIALFFPDKANEYLEVKHSINLHDLEDIISTPNDIHKEHFKISNRDSLAVHAFHSTETIIIEDCDENDHRFMAFDAKQREKIKCIVGIPLSYNDKPIGVIIVDSKLRKHFTNDNDFGYIFRLLSNQMSHRVYYELYLRKLLDYSYE